MNLDFSVLNELKNKAVGGDYKGDKAETYISRPLKIKTPNNALKTPNKGIGLKSDIKDEEEAGKRYLALEKDQKLIKLAQESDKRDRGNIQKSETLRAEINHEVKANSSLFTILERAIKCISLMTGDSVFYDENLKALITNETARGNPDIKLFEIEEIEQGILSLKAKEQTPEIEEIITKYEQKQRDLIKEYNKQLNLR